MVCVYWRQNAKMGIVPPASQWWRLVLVLVVGRGELYDTCLVLYT